MLVSLILCGILISMLTFSKVYRLIVWSAFRHPFKTTYIYKDESGKVWAEHG